MRAITSFGALVATSLVHRVTAQAPAYGSPDGGSGADPNGNPGGSPPSGGDTGDTVGTRDASFSGPTCVMEATTTVFITVHPTSPIGSDGGSPDGSGSGPTVLATRTIQVSPINSAQATELVPSPFTTITIDISGEDPGSGGNSGPVTGSPSGSPGQDGSSPSGAHLSDSPASYHDGSDAPWPNQATVTSGIAGSDASAGPVATTVNVPHGGSPWYTVVTDSSVQWVTGSDGPKPITILSEHTLTIGGAPTKLPGQGEPLTCITTIGPDGRPTILEWPAGDSQGANGGRPISTAAGVTTDINGNPVPQGASTVIYPSSPVVTGMDSQPSPPVGGPVMSTACTTYTVLGTDGTPTVVHSSWLVPQNAPPTAASGALPTAGSVPVQTGNLPNGNAVTTCTSYTILGADGKPTVVESTLVLPGAQSTQAGAPGTPSGGIPIQVTVPGSPGPVISGGPGGLLGVTTCTTYTVLGTDGRPTIVDTTYVVPGPVATPVSTDVGGGVLTGAPNQSNGSPGLPQSGNAGQPGITTCITYTAIGPDGRPTIVESTVVMPASDAVPTASGLGFPSAVPPQQSGLPQGISVTAGNLITTAVTVDVLGPNGVATPVVETIVLTPSTPGVPALPTVTSVGFPSIAPQQMPTDLPQGIPPSTPGNAVTTCITVDIVGPNGVATPVVQTIVLTPTAPDTGNPTAGPIANTAGLSLPPSGQAPGLSTVLSGAPPLDAYGSDVPNPQTVFPPSAAVSGLDGLPTGVVPGSGNTIYTVVTRSNGIPVLSPITTVPLPSYGGSQQDGAAPGGNGAPAGTPTGAGQVPNGYGWGPSQAGAAYGPLSFGAAATALQTATWTNVIPEQTTTYTINFPFTTLVTVAVPDEHAVRRQVRSSPSPQNTAWANSTSSLEVNTSLAASLTSVLGAPTASSFPASSTPVPTASIGPGHGESRMCPSGGKIGNTTVDFDNLKPGPLFNPSGDIWFSEGFLVAPPSTPASESFAPASGGQLVEFVPASLSGSPTSHGADVAEIGVGPNSANPCFRFDFLGADLGCAAQGNEKWCEFEVSAYTFNEGSFSEQSIAWSETKRVPACPTFPSSSCALTPVEFEGYTNITSVLISLHVGLDLRAWWGDDFKFGWTDNSCEAASCRGRALPHRVKRETVESAIRHGVWHWTAEGLQRLDDEYIWESAA
ncbi:hypothetical protein JDV02_002974 [Purpureocillium takamizusanense]|uniref:DUF7371 domain-containing protein n=1 Tax=Purpureocillium takamizusanense TaxID=2060973 RepID=A0A9Q8V8B4_9HYPO|nr:uncharacterized protein JDV02_002974 [Purpureocillium takamizusanense]UNI16548.1 hypothetical protein JDV02_002974 [Purpureocillium takamizusanense]